MSHELLVGTTLRRRTADAVADDHLRSTLQYVTDRLATSRQAGAGLLDNWEELRTAARALRADTIARLPEILERLADNWERNGGHVFWAADAEEARQHIAAIAARHGARKVVKSKSMATEEIGLNELLEARGVEVVETDLGEWIIQLADQPPSHIIAPAIHLTRDDVQDIFNKEPASGGGLSNVPEELCAFAREQLRQEFLSADIGISGCNVAVAETGSMVLVTNEGNGRMVTSVPKVHVAVMGMERVVETWEQLDLLMTLLPRAATGQDLSVYCTQVTGPRRADEGEVDGPDELHLVILDNGRSELIGGEFQEMLNCIRCGACLNVCPGVPPGRRPRLRLVLLGAHGCGAHPVAEPGRGGRRAVGGVDAVRGLLRGLPGEDPPPGPAAVVAPPAGGRGPPGPEGGVGGVGGGLVPPRRLPGLDRRGRPGGAGAAHQAVPRRLGRRSGGAPSPQGPLVPHPLPARRHLRAGPERGAPGLPRRVAGPARRRRPTAQPAPPHRAVRGDPRHRPSPPRRAAGARCSPRRRRRTPGRYVGWPTRPAFLRWLPRCARPRRSVPRC